MNKTNILYIFSGNYQSPYMVVTNEQYTKHYFMGSQRVTSKIGGGMQENPVDPINEHIDPSPFNKDLSNIAEDLYTMMSRSFECTGQDSRNVNFDPEFPVIENAVSENQEEEDIYYYHTDHLGSSSWITYTDGSVTQHMQNLPFGEPFIDQRATGYDIRFKFTGKEMDSETGYQYFGARYYDSDLSVWLSVDPLSDERQGLSPYNYVQWNPLNRIDPTGMLDWEPGIDDDGNTTYTAEKGDSYDSFKRQYKLTDDQASKMLDKNTDVVAGETVIKGEDVKKAMGTEVLKLDMWDDETTSDDLNKHAAFMINHKNYEADQNWDNWEGNIKDYFHGFEGLENNSGGKMVRKHTEVKLGSEMKDVRVTIRSGSDGRFDPSITYGGTTAKGEVKWVVYHSDPTKHGIKFPLIIFYEPQN